jgi:hypothetical protein
VATICALAAPVLTAFPAQAAIEPTVKISRIYYDSPGPDLHSNKSLNGEYVAVKNTSRFRTVNLSRWTITGSSRHHYRPENRYRFEHGVFIRPGQTIVIKTGRGLDGPFVKYRGERTHVWSNFEGSATLRTAMGHRVDFCHYSRWHAQRYDYKNC